MRIALVITGMEAGGAEQALAALATGLDRARFAPVVYSLRPRPTGEQASVAGRLETAGIPVQCLDARSARDFPSIVRRLAQRFREQRPSLVQSFLFHANIAARLAAWRAGVPVMLSGIRVAERRGRWRLWADRLTDRLVAKHVCVSRDVAEFSAQTGRLPRHKLVVIPNGVDVVRFRDAQCADLSELAGGAKRRYVIYVGRLDEQKGVRWLLEHAATWMKRLVAHDLLIVGEGPYRSALERAAREENIAQRVHFLGWRSDVPSLLKAADVLVLPSQWEGMPNVVLEAMAAGRAIVANRVEGVAELLGPGADQQTVAGREGQAFANLLGDIASNPLQRNELGAINQRRAEAEFSLERAANAYAELWNSLLPALPNVGAKKNRE
jgi:glycosyltransferase involved in cell wall biosynthesis